MTDFSAFLKNNSDALVGLGAGLMSGRTVQDQLSGGLTGFATARKAAQTKNATLQWLQDNNPDLAQLMASGAVDPQSAVKLAWEQRTKSEKPQNPYMSAGGSLYNWQTGQWVTPPGGGAAGDQNEFGLTAIPGVDKDNNPILIQVGKNGTGVQSKLPDGVKPLSPYDKSSQITTGKEDATNLVKAKQDLPIAEQSTNDAINLAEQIKNDPNLDHVVGRVNSILPTFRQSSVDLEAKIAQLKGGAFLQARQLLKGGGAITDYEGAKAEDALVRASTAQSKEAFQQAMNEYESHLKNGLEMLRQKVGGSDPSQGAPAMAPAAPGKTATGVGWSIEGN